MKNDLKILAVALEKKLGREHLQHEEKHRNNKLLHKVWEIMKGKEKPSQQILNRLALLAGFQSWADLQGALHGTDDGLTNYSAGEYGNIERASYRKMGCPFQILILIGN